MCIFYAVRILQFLQTIAERPANNITTKPSHKTKTPENKQRCCYLGTCYVGYKYM